MTDFAQRYGRWAVIAGASEGIGASLADQLAALGMDLVLIARNGPLLDEVAARAREEHGVQTRAVVQDLTDPDVGAKIADATDGLDVGLLIYNAGASERTTPFLDNEIEYSLKQVALDCTAPITLAHHFGEAMVERGRGGIVLVASLACLAGSATLAMYSAVTPPRTCCPKTWPARSSRTSETGRCTSSARTTGPPRRRSGPSIDAHSSR